MASFARLCLTVLFAAVLVSGAAAVGVASHYDESRFEPGDKNDVRVHTYGDSPEAQRRPGESGVDYWTESIFHAVPRDQSVYLQRSVTYRPVPSDCGAADTETLGIDRGNTNEGERTVDEDVSSSIKSFSEDDDARARYEERFGSDGPLTTTDWSYVERIEVRWYDRDDFGPPVRLDNQDRFVSAQQDCYENPDVAGWYRSATYGVVELENGTTVESNGPTFSHWFYVCECSDREEAVETLGPPPSAESTPTPTATESGADEETAADGARETDDEESDAIGEESDATGEESTPAPTDTETATAATATPESTAAGDGGGAPAATETPGPDWEEYRVQTPTPANGAGLTPLGALVSAALAALVALRRR